MKKKLLLGAAAFGLFLTGCNAYHIENNSIWTAPPLVLPAGGDSFGFTPGTHSGVGTGGFYGNIEVDVTVSEDAILDIVVTYNNETPMFAEPAFARLTADILAGQFTGVDSFTGSTMTSNAFLEAVENALVAAGGDLSLIRFGINETVRHFTPGTFRGTGVGFYGEMVVDVTFSANAIDSINVVSFKDTPSFVGGVINNLGPLVIALQSTDVDAHAGATASSGAFLASINAAIAQAEIEAPTIMPLPDVIEPESEESESESDEPEPESEELEPESDEPPTPVATTAAPAVADTPVADTPVVETPVVEAPAEPAGRFTPGTFSGTGAGGFGGPITVSITVDANNITAVSVTSHSETPAFADPAFAQLIPAVLSAQSSNVSAFSGATETSNAFRAAVNSAINQASN